MSAACVAGIDGGGSGTSAVVADLDGRVLGRGASGSANTQVVGDDGALRAVTTALDAALAASSRARNDLRATAAGLAGLHTAADRARFAALAAPLCPAGRLTVWTDADVALAAAIGGGSGIVVIAGTGSIALGRDGMGRLARSGGWGYLIGDEGSAHAIALAGLRAASCAVDGRAAASLLPRLFADAFGVAAFDEVLRPLYGPPALSRRALAQLAPVVGEAAIAGDSAARGVLEEAALHLASMAITVAKGLDLGAAHYPLACSGGVWQAGALLRAPFERAVSAALPGALVGPPALAPAAGAAFLALSDLAGTAATACFTALIARDLGRPHRQSFVDGALLRQKPLVQGLRPEPE